MAQSPSSWIMDGYRGTILRRGFEEIQGQSMDHNRMHEMEPLGDGESLEAVAWTDMFRDGRSVCKPLIIESGGTAPFISTTEACTHTTFQSFLVDIPQIHSKLNS
jgi:hypothetical protein